MNVNRDDKIIAVVVLLLAVALFATRLFAQQFEYRGVYTAEQVFTHLCDNCYLELPSEFLQTNLVLSVSSDDSKALNRALVSAARGSGWALSKRGSLWHAEPVQNDGNLVYLSCMSNEPVNVPKYLYWYAVKSDSIRCHRRDSLQARNDSVAHAERMRQDSITRAVDSLSRLRLPFKRYELRYYSYTKNFTDKIGVEFSGMLARGNLHDRFKIFDDWQFYATSTNDTTFTSRFVNVAFDSTLNLDWGTEEQTLKTSYVSSNGYVSNDYEWRKYGLVVTMKKDTAKTYLTYVFRDKEQNISVLQGSAVGDIGDTLTVTGQYTTSRVVRTGVPFLSSIPVLGLLFSTEQTMTDVKRFELYLVPTEKKAVQDGQVQRTVSTAAADTAAAKRDTIDSGQGGL